MKLPLVALCPELSAGSAEEGRLACLTGLFVGFLVHVCYHKDLKGLAVLHHYREQAVCIL